MRRVTLADFTAAAEHREGMADLVEADAQMAIGEILSPVEPVTHRQLAPGELPNDEEIAAVTLAVSHFSAFCLGVAVARRLCEASTNRQEV